MSVKLITFDVVGTLVRFKGHIPSVYAQAGRKYGVNADSEKIAKGFKSTFKELSAKYPNFGARSELTSKDWWKLFVTNTFVASGYESPHLDQIAHDLFTTFSSNEGYEVFEETYNVLDLLKSFKQKGDMKFGVISNTDERLHGVLKSLKIHHHFDFVLTSRECKSEKPNPSIFLQALKQGNVKAEQALHIGDDEVKDFGGATSVGMNAILLSRTGKMPLIDIKTLLPNEFSKLPVSKVSFVNPLVFVK